MGWVECNKIKYDKKGAQTALNNILKNLKHNERRKENRIYHCPLCNAWHLTSTDDLPGIDGKKFEIVIHKDWF